MTTFAQQPATKGKTETINFDSAAPGSLPAGWSTAMTHQGGAPKWEVLKNETAPSKPNVLAQTSNDSTGGRFPLAIYDRVNLKDIEISVKFLPVSGRGDQAAGIVWRYRDPNNYYIVRANAMENNVVLYKVEDGKRISLAPKGTPSNTYGVKHPVPSGKWSTLGVRAQGNSFTVFFDGKEIFQVEDSTFTGAGKTGLWTKADSVTYFDDLTITDLSGSASAPQAEKIYAQRLVDKLAAKHPEVERIGLHVTPPNKSENIIIACNLPERIGRKSDPEDLESMKTGQPVVLREGTNFDVTLPLHDATGKVIGALGLTLKPSGGEKEEGAKRRAQAIASELEKQIASKDGLFRT